MDGAECVGFLAGLGDLLFELRQLVEWNGGQKGIGGPLALRQRLKGRIGHPTRRHLCGFGGSVVRGAECQTRGVQSGSKASRTLDDD